MKLHFLTEDELRFAKRLGLRVKELHTEFRGVGFYEAGLNDDDDIKRFLEAYYGLPLVTTEEWENNTPSEFYELAEKMGGVIREHHLRVWILGNFTKEQWRKAVEELHQQLLEQLRTCRYCGKKFEDSFLCFKHERICDVKSSENIS